MSVPPPGRPRIGISSCLLGRRVRFDGGHKRNDFLSAVLTHYIEYVPVCPEVEIGLGTPRPPIRLQRSREAETRLIVIESGEDLSDRMRDYAMARIDELIAGGLHGFILKSRSPSCGLAASVSGSGAQGARPGGSLPTQDPVAIELDAPQDEPGAFTRELLARLPDLPVAEEDGLDEPGARESFVAAAFTCLRWAEAEAEGWTPGSLARFHARHRTLLRSRDLEACEGLDTLVGTPKSPSDRADPAYYLSEVIALLRHPPAREGHARALEGLVARLSGSLRDGDSERRIRERIDDLSRGRVPAVVPLLVLRDEIRDGLEPRARDDVYLDPHDDELALLSLLQAEPVDTEGG